MRSFESGLEVLRSLVPSISASLDDDAACRDAAVYVGSDDRGVGIELVTAADDRDEGELTVVCAMPTARRQ